jgi:hypothetical protein
VAGLVPAIHVFAEDVTKKDVDARHKPGMTNRIAVFVFPENKFDF